MANADGTYTLPPGIYFDLPEEIYHSDTSLGSTSIKELAKMPCKWQYERLRPRKEVEVEHLTWGRAWHCRVLEGEAEFAKRYANPPTSSDYPDALNTADQIKDFLKKHGQKTSGNKPELIARAKDLDECPEFFDEILARWHFDHPKHQNLSDRQVREIEDAVDNMARDPILVSVMQAGSMIHGAAEMSIFWVDERGIRRKCRLDYSLAPTSGRPQSLVVDLKSLTSFKGGTDEEAGMRKIYDECYDLQVAGYMDGIRSARDLLAHGMVFGTPPDGDYLHSFLHAPRFDWVWVMIRRDNGYVPMIMSADTQDEMFAHAKNIIGAALDVYLNYLQLWGPNELWTPPSKTPLRLNKSVMPTYNRGIQYEQPNHR